MNVKVVLKLYFAVVCGSIETGSDCGSSESTLGRVSGLSINVLLLSLRSGVAVIMNRRLNVLVLKCACGGFSLATLKFLEKLWVGRHSMMIPGGCGSCACCTVLVVMLW